MKGRLAGEIRQYYNAPLPKQRDAFLKKRYVPRRKASSMLLVQLRYIPKYAWLLSMLLFLLMLLAGRLLRYEIVGVLYALVPFGSVLTVSVSMRSCQHHMAELESATLFSLGSVIMMRMLILGIGNLFTLIVTAAFSGRMFIAVLMYMLVPYMLTAIGGLMVHRRYPPRSANYASLAISGAVIGFELTFAREAAFVYRKQYIGLWAAATVILALLLAAQIRKSFEMASSYL